MSSLSLPLGFTAAGAAIMIYQMGGNAMPENPAMPAINPTVVSPFLYVTATPELLSGLLIILTLTPLPSCQATRQSKKWEKRFSPI